MNAMDTALAAKYEANGGGLKGRFKTFGQGLKAGGAGIKDAMKKGGKAVGSYFAAKMQAKKGPSPELKKMSVNLADNKPRKGGSPALREMSIRLAKQHAAKK